MSLETPRLRLLPCAPEHLLALIDQPERFGQVLGLPAADGLHGFYVSDDVSPTWLAALRSSSSPDPWRHGFFVVHREAASVIGSAGFKGPPDSAGVVEVAYGIVPGFQGHGYATEAAAALLAFAFACTGPAGSGAHLAGGECFHPRAFEVRFPPPRHGGRP